MPGKSFQPLGHINQFPDLLVLLVHSFEFRVNRQCPLKRNIQLCRHHFRNTVHECVRQVHNPSYVPYNASGSHRTKGDDLHHPVGSIFLHYIVDDLLPALEAEVHVNIGHGYAFRIQETLKQQLVLNWVDTGNSKGIRYDAARRRPSSRTYHDAMIPGIFDKVPHNQEIIHISHGLDYRQFVLQTLL